MKKNFIQLVLLGSLFFIGVRLQAQKVKKLPYKKQGLTEKAAAAHLLNRFSFGAKPGDIDNVAALGIGKWLQMQFKANNADTLILSKLKPLNAWTFNNEEIAALYPRPGLVNRMAEKEGYLNGLLKDSIGNDTKEKRELIKKYMEDKGYRPQQELFKDFVNAKFWRATYSENQLLEVMTDFWFNHFNVSITKNECAAFIPVYERETIRAHALGKFEDLLIATAKSPAMLSYLDNSSSTGTNSMLTKNNHEKQLNALIALQQKEMNYTEEEKKEVKSQLSQIRKYNGLNENYARELMELHTLGVDGGYTQKDVTEAARILTGWTIYPMNEGKGSKALKNILDRLGDNEFAKRGFVHEGDFLFAANRHDNGEKTVLGKKFDADRGIDEGLELLHMLATHPNTAKFVCRKIAAHFVCDTPSQALVDKLAQTFLKENGDIKAVLTTLVQSDEFWSKDAVRAKIKSPFELIVSACRSLNAEVKEPYQLFNWSTRMGQKIYSYQAPTGFPDRGQYWINTGSLLNRMNFGLALANQKIPGIQLNLAKLNDNHEPESADQALKIYSQILMPERDLTTTITRLTPLLNVPNLDKKIIGAVQQKQPTEMPVSFANLQTSGDAMHSDEMSSDDYKGKKKNKENPKSKKTMNPEQMVAAKGNFTMLSQVVGIIIGSPEFQRK